MDSSAVSWLDLPALTLDLVQGKFPTIDRLHARISMPSVVALPHQCDRVWRGVRTLRRKLVLNADGSPWLFFDLESDPGERVNLADAPERSGEIARLSPLA
jgi:hypothetical protein